MKTRYGLDLRSRVSHWILERKFDEISRMADRLFRERCADAVLEEYMASLPLAGLPEIRCALTSPKQHYVQEPLEQVVRTVLIRDWRQLSATTIDYAAGIYVDCLGRALLQMARTRPADGHSEQARVRLLGARGV
jgi:hypothetical protein